MLLPMNPAQWMGPAFPAFPSPTGATPFDTDLAELGRQRPNGPIHWHLTLDQSPFKHNRTAGLQQNKTDNHTAGLQQNKTVPPATSGRSVDDFFVIAYQFYALALGLLIAYLISTAV